MWESGENADLTEMETVTSVRSPPNQPPRFLPRGDTLPAAVWKKRHRFLAALLAGHALALPIFGMAMGFSVVHSVVEGGLIPGTLAVAALLIPGPRKVCAGLVSLGLLSCSALLVYFSGGYIEAHFHFFIVIVIIGLYEDWLPFGLALVFVQLHHGIAGAIDPSAVYNHPAAQEHPWLWAAIHEAGISVAAVLSIGAWKINEELRAQRLAAARARAVAAADETRRRVERAADDARRAIERDLHDGAQQQFVAVAMRLESARQLVEPTDAARLVEATRTDLRDAIEELRRLAHGIHPAELSERGLVAALRTLARQSATPVDVKVDAVGRLSPEIETAAYFIAAEATANAVKHAHADHVEIALAHTPDALRVTVADDGVGGAVFGHGTGLEGLRDRADAAGGHLTLVSPAGGPTLVMAELPLLGSRSERN
jgi:signal transduction histidine kinase